METTKIKTGMIREYFESEKQMQLSQFLTMISLDNDETQELSITKDFLLLSNSTTDQRLALEYFYINRSYQEVQYFIKLNKEHCHPLNKNSAKLYQLMLDLRAGKPAHEVRALAKTVSADTPELKCIKYFLNIEVDSKVYNFERIGYFLNKIQKQICYVDNPLLITFFNSRIQIILFHYYWKRNELILARKHAYEALQLPHQAKQKAELHLNLALTYIYEDFHSCLYHIEEAKYLAIALDDRETLDMIDNFTYPFVCAHFGKTEGVDTKHPVEKAHLEIAKGNFDVATQMLEGLEFTTPFSQYYLGLATKKQHFFIHSYQHFMEKRSDHFFAKLPLKASEGLGL
ncbi:AimR family lysis-lysogeny pheromone receptor [Gracilibacillus caseinilyticus]|uniref:AimR family lysis-lysogeny pheromone receptor n=1 Tax=Gracilibacillus caseinilyticus TaxID=2932256 RepID=A0ABY4F155_9BACI|nr:AimR family lysis-lysogeny pheromone receptor [Gracilibacillus caseinilyticus]UOQ50263.1 AimR family lysis-lysogeny pheromone receptor [Gracilibacillus caseinilyticus]